MRIQDELISLVEEQMLHGGFNSVDTKEMSEIADMIKDLSEAMYYCEKAKEAKMCLEEMEYGNKEHDYRDMDRREGRMYYPIAYNRGGSSGGGWGSTSSGNMGGSSYVRGGGRGGRRGYEDGHGDMHELEKYVESLTDEMMDVLKDMSPEEKAKMQKKISELASKIR